MLLFSANVEVSLSATLSNDHVLPESRFVVCEVVGTGLRANDDSILAVAANKIANAETFTNRFDRPFFFIDQAYRGVDGVTGAANSVCVAWQ